MANKCGLGQREVANAVVECPMVELNWRKPYNNQYRGHTVLHPDLVHLLLHRSPELQLLHFDIPLEASSPEERRYSRPILSLMLGSSLDSGNRHLPLLFQHPAYCSDHGLDLLVLQ